MDYTSDTLPRLQDFKKLETITIPENVTHFMYDSGEFRGCTNLKTVILPQSQLYILGDTFYGCEKLYYIDIPKGTRIGGSGFTHSGIVEITIDQQMIESDTFAHCKNLKKVICSDRLESIGENAFYDCTSLEEVVIPNSTQSIDFRSFANCSNLKTIIIPLSVESINNSAFDHSPEVTIVGAENSYAHEYAAKNGIPFIVHDHNYGDWEITTPATEIAPGVQTHVCSRCGEKETQEIAQLKPSLKAVTILKPKAEKKAATIKWKQVSKKNLKKIKKIEIQYSTDKNFKKNVKSKYASAKKTSYKIKKLKSKKKYYVRIRAYTKSGKQVHVSKWSAKKSFKVK